MQFVPNFIYFRELRGNRQISGLKKSKMEQLSCSKFGKKDVPKFLP